MNWLITGGAGFIGTNLIRRLSSMSGTYVKIIDKEGKGLKTGSDFWLYDDVCGPSIFDCFKDTDVVVHLAAQSGVEASTEDPIGTFNNNVFGTLNCLEAARRAGVNKFIFASSGGTVLGKQNEPLREDMLPNPVTTYGASKLACESYCKAYNYTYGLDTTILRFSNVYGPYSDKKKVNLIPRFIMNAINKETCYINGDGTINKDYIFVEDLLNVIIASAEFSHTAGKVYQVGSGTATDINDVACIIDQLTEKLIGHNLIIKNKEERIGDVSYECNIEKVTKELSFCPKYDLNSGIEITFRWFLDNLEVL